MMKRIGLLSDTHGNLDERILHFFENVDEIWHAGDFGAPEVAKKLASFKTLRGVAGNIDGLEITQLFPFEMQFRCEETEVWMIHAGGYPGHYHPSIRNKLIFDPPGLLVCGHSHILRIIYDKKLNFLYLNPGAAGRTGIHTLKTALRFVISKTEIRELEIWQSEKF